jgi:hypothetical protein
MTISRGELESQLSTGALTEHPHKYGATVYSFSVPGKDALSTWRRLRQAAPGLGYWPVIFGEPKRVTRVCGVIATEHADDPMETIRQANETDVQKYFQERAEEFSDEHYHGEWPGQPEKMGMLDFTIPRKILPPCDFHESVVIGLIPVKHFWEVPAVLTFGGWNDCPFAKDQVAVLRYWNEIYGAELVGLSGDVMELEVPKKPSTKEEALKLAQEQYWFCYDIVQQGCETIENLAGGLMTSKIWYFWWD